MRLTLSRTKLDKHRENAEKRTFGLHFPVEKSARVWDAYRTFNQVVVGSSPTALTKTKAKSFSHFRPKVQKLQKDRVSL